MCADLPARVGLFSQDFWDPTAWRQQGLCLQDDVHSHREAAACVRPELPGWMSTWELPPGPHGPMEAPHPNLIWSFSSWALCPSKHTPGKTLQAPSMRRTWYSSLGSENANKKLAVFAQTKADPPLAGVVQLPLQGSWEENMCMGGGLGGGRETHKGSVWAQLFLQWLK
jgi:hypothetical protein